MLLQGAFVLFRNLQKPLRPQTFFSRNIFHQPRLVGGNGLCKPPSEAYMQNLRSYRNTPPRISKLEPTPFDTNLSLGCNCGVRQKPTIPRRNIVRACLFAGAFTIGTFMAATILEYENARKSIANKEKKGKFPWFPRQTKNQATGIKQNTWETFKQDVRNNWNKLTPGEKVFAPICVANLIVFGLWRLPSMRKTMLTYFCSNPAARVVCWPMFLSTFSHYSALHIFANMYVLHSFADAAVSSLGMEQFLAVYLSGGVLSSLASIVYKAATSQTGLSIGASGAIMAILAYVCTQFPDTKLSILFLPMLTFSAGATIKVIMGIDLAGCLLGWKFFDHAAHLGGALFGVFWVYYGDELWRKRMRLTNKYHEWRTTK